MEMTDGDTRVPEHKLEETNDGIIITIFAPLAKPKTAAILLEKNVFTFDSPPYFLKVKLPYPVTDRSSVEEYDSVAKSYKVTLKKKIKQSKSSDEDDEEEEVQEILDFSDGVNNTSVNKTEVKKKYGFANNYSNMFGKLYDEFSEVINLPNPDKTDVKDRKKLRIKEEDEKWRDDHYLADTMETDHLESIFEYTPPWVSSPVTDDLKSDEKEVLTELLSSTKKKKLSKSEKKLCELQLVDILFGYAYNKRTTEGDNTVESGWTINKLSSTLSWFEVFEDLRQVTLACYKRCLTFPLYRNWELCQLIHKDVTKILKLGNKQVIRCLLEVRDIFNESENRYVLNILYINDLICFVSDMSNERLMELAKDLKKISVKKFEVNSDLPLLEIAAHLALEEEENDTQDKDLESNIKNIVGQISNLKLGRKSESSSEDSSELSESEDSNSTQSSDNDEN